jgi:DNA-binding HxlR family transcriptional regulator
MEVEQYMRVQIDWAPAYELIASYQAYINPPHPKVLEMGAGWIKQVRPLLPDWFDAEAKAIPADMEFPPVLVSVCPGARDAEALLGWLEAMSPGELYDLISMKMGKNAPPPSALADARDRHVRLLKAWNERYFQTLDPRVLSGLAAEAERWRRQAETMAVDEVVAVATSGLRIEGPADLEQVMLVPQYHCRPVNLLHWYPGGVWILYGADALAPVPTEVPPGLRRLIRALDDDSRLQILRALSEKPLTFTEVVELAGLAKSTVHHHLVALRAAGLVWVHTAGSVPDRYSLRLDSLDHLGPALKDFLGGA